MSDSPAPPPCMHLDDPAAAEPARQRLARKSPFRIFASLPNLRQTTRSSSSRKKPKRKPKRRASDELSAVESIQVQSPRNPGMNSPSLIRLDKSATDEDESRDLYRWAVLYENQRGYVQCLPPLPTILEPVHQGNCLLHALLLQPFSSPNRPSPFHNPFHISKTFQTT
jgi:hypothetical protein